MVDPLGTIISELKAANVASQRVRGFEPAPASASYEGDAQEAGSYKRFVVLVRLGGSRLPRAPLQQLQIGVRAYGVTPHDAAALWGDISDALSNAGPRLSASRVAIYQSLDDGSGGTHKDPDTDQPYEEGVIAVYAGTAALP